MRKVIDLTGQRFGRLVALRRDGQMNGQAAWCCRCDCGRESRVPGARLRRGFSRSCGCNRSSPEAVAKRTATMTRVGNRRVIDLAGQRFGKLVVLERAGSESLCGKPGQATWLVRCDCDPHGERAYAVAGSNLRRGLVQSCGCLRVEQIAARSETHGLTKGLAMTGSRTLHPSYSIWINMRRRCHSPSCSAYGTYGARGIKVCARWREDFGAFVADMGARPSLRHSVDRIDNNRGYECGHAECSDCGPLGRAPNCRWATPAEQARNISRNRNITIEGETKCLAEWARIAGVRPAVLAGRLNRGAAPADAIRAPLRSHIAQTRNIHAPYRDEAIVSGEWF